MRPLRLSLVIPAYNEEGRLPAFLAQAQSYLAAEFGDFFEILVVDDGSRDGTSAAVRRLLGEGSLLRLNQNQGKGAAVRAGMLAARGELVLFADADGATPMEEEAVLRKAIEAGSEVAIGSRAEGGVSHFTWLPRRQSGLRSPSVAPDRLVLWHRYLIGRAFAGIVNALVGIGIKDTQCGFKMFRRRSVPAIFTDLKTRRFCFDVEVLVRAKELGLRVTEVGVRWNEKAGSKVNVFVDSFRMFFELIQIRKAHRQRMRDKTAVPPMRAAS